MKTSAQTSVQNHQAGVKLQNKLAQLFILVWMMLIGSMQLSAQDAMSGRTFLDLGLDFSSSGNGHGAFYSPSLILNKNFNGFGVSPMIYKNDNKLSGLKVSYMRNLSGKVKDEFDEVNLSYEDSIGLVEYKGYKMNHRDALQINFYSYMQYNQSISLSSAFVNNESQTNAEKDVNWNNVKVSTGEVGAGFQLQYNINNNIGFRVYSGIGAFHHFDYQHELNNGRNSISLNLGATLVYTFDVLHPFPKMVKH